MSIGTKTYKDKLAAKPSADCSAGDPLDLEVGKAAAARKAKAAHFAGF